MVVATAPKITLHCVRWSCEEENARSSKEAHSAPAPTMARISMPGKREEAGKERRMGGLPSSPSEELDKVTF